MHLCDIGIKLEERDEAGNKRFSEERGLNLMHNQYSCPWPVLAGIEFHLYLISNYYI